MLNDAQISQDARLASASGKHLPRSSSADTQT